MHLQCRRVLLKQRTSLAHVAVESAVGTVTSLDGYVRYVRGLHAFRVPIEIAIDQIEWPDAFGGWRPLTIRCQLAADLCDLGHRPPPHLAASDGLLDVSVLLGILYVLEGSALGARVLFSRARRLGLHGHNGARHLARQAASSENWKSYLRLLEHVEEFELETAVRSANATFLKAQQAMTRCENGPD